MTKGLCFIFGTICDETFLERLRSPKSAKNKSRMTWQMRKLCYNENKVKESQSQRNSNFCAGCVSLGFLEQSLIFQTM